MLGGERKFIHRIKHNEGWVTEHDHKEDIIHDHFASVMGRGPSRVMDLNWENLHFGEVGMEGIDAPFTVEEVQQAINQMPSNKAPGPDGFTGAFFKKCWSIIKEDVMRDTSI